MCFLHGSLHIHRQGLINCLMPFKSATATALIRWAKWNMWHPGMRNLWVLSAFITAIASRQNKGNSTVLALRFSCGSPESSMAHSGHLHTQTYTRAHRWIGFAVQWSYVPRGSDWAVTSLHYREASIIQYTVSGFLVLYDLCWACDGLDSLKIWTFIGLLCWRGPGICVRVDEKLNRKTGKPNG